MNEVNAIKPVSYRYYILKQTSYLDKFPKTHKKPLFPELVFGNVAVVFF